MNSFLGDVRYAVRRLVKHPALPVTAVLILALGIGVNAATFSLIDAMLLRPLPYRDADRLVALNETHPKTGTQWGLISVPNYLDWREQTQAFAGIGAYARKSYNASTEQEPERLSGSTVSANLFQVLGVAPALGRAFLPEEEESGRGKVAILGHALWERRFGSDPGVVGKTVTLDGEVHQVVGVMPPGFAFPEWAEVWTPIDYQPALGRRADRALDAVARLRPGATVRTAQTELASLAGRLAERHPKENEGWSARVQPLRDQLMPAGPRIGLYLMLAAVGCLLLIVAGNVAALVLAQTAARRQEIAVRIALGADRRHLVRQMLTENLVLALLGGLVGVLVSMGMIRLMLAAIPVQIPFWIDFGLSGRVLGFTLALSLGVGLLFGLTPALQGSRMEQFAYLKEGGARGGSGGRARGRFLNGLVMGEFALSMVLLTSAVLMATSFLKLRAASPGFDPQGVLTVRLSLTARQHADPAHRARLVTQVLERVRNLPGVESAGAVEYLPVSQEGYGVARVTAEGATVTPGEEPRATSHASSTGYLSTMRIPLAAGRDFTGREVEESSSVAIVSESLARRLWPGESALGRRLRTDRTAEGEWLTVIGVAGTVRPGVQTAGVDSWPADQLYLPQPRGQFPNVAIAVRARGDAAALSSAVRSEVWAVDRSVPVFNVLTMDEVITRVLWLPRFWGQVFGLFGAMALLITAIGIYGVTSYAVGQRTREVGIRLAVGASDGQILGMVLKGTLVVAGIGLGVGLLLGLASSRALSALLYGVSGTDPLVFAGVLTLLATVAIVATLVPAVRATRVDPVEVLRKD